MPLPSSPRFGATVVYRFPFRRLVNFFDEGVQVGNLEEPVVVDGVPIDRDLSLIPPVAKGVARDSEILRGFFYRDICI